MYDFDKAIDRRGTTSIKWNKQYAFGRKDGLLPFWIADTDFASVPEILEAMKERCNHPVIGYSEPLDSVYTAIQGWWERRHQWRPETDWMLLSYGVVTGIYFTLNVVVPKGEKVLVFTPVYDPFFAAVRNSGHTLVDCPLVHEDNYYSINFKAFEEELKNGVKARDLHFYSVSCMHCADAPCVMGCPCGCLTKDTETGFTLYDTTNCIGCHSCAMACPYGVPSFGSDGKMRKCDACIERQKAGLVPACVKVCPTDALTLLTEDEFKAGQVAQQKKSHAYDEETTGEVRQDKMWIGIVSVFKKHSLKATRVQAVQALLMGPVE